MNVLVSQQHTDHFTARTQTLLLVLCYIPMEFQCFKHTLATLLPELKLLFCIIFVVLLVSLQHTGHFTAGTQTQTVLHNPCGVLVSLQTH